MPLPCHSASFTNLTQSHIKSQTFFHSVEIEIENVEILNLYYKNVCIHLYPFSSSEISSLKSFPFSFSTPCFYLLGRSKFKEPKPNSEFRLEYNAFLSLLLRQDHVTQSLLYSPIKLALISNPLDPIIIWLLATTDSLSSPHSLFQLLTQTGKY